MAVKRRFGTLLVGLSGWSYPEWKDNFYAGVPPRLWLAHVAAHFPAVEINIGYYRWLRRSVIEAWMRQTPPAFRFAAKGPRTVTHVRRLKNVAEVVAQQRETYSAFGDRLAAVLWQMPANFRKDEERARRLSDFAALLGAEWPSARHVVELRHRSWFDDDTAAALARHRIASCQSDAADWPMWDAVTTDLVYIRLHGHTRTYASGYSRASLERWAGRIGRWRAEGRDVQVYFDNTAMGHAPRDALRLLDLAGRTTAQETGRAA
jgi:uncharacterized protein YecE (DUF72 family)